MTGFFSFPGTEWRHIIQNFPYMTRLFNRYQDGMIFIGSTSNQHQELLVKLAVLTVRNPFRKNCPVIMPIKYSTIMDLKLDSNIIFYMEEKNGTYRLIDKFAVKGGAPIVLELGTWDKGYGVKLNKKINRPPYRSVWSPICKCIKFLQDLWKFDLRQEWHYKWNKGVVPGYSVLHH